MTLTFKIQLRDITKPPVWRRLEIPGNFTFDDLHNTIQSAFGWWNSHLYQFEKSPFCHGWKVKEPSEYDDQMGDDVEDAATTVVADFIKRKRLNKFVYVYDFGDSWVHDITLEKKDDETSRSYPVCLAGKGACPHEDCGGVWGWEEIKRLFREEPDSDETESYREWLQLDDDEEFDPNHFDIEEVNSKLRMIIADSKDERNESETGVARKIIKGPKPITLLENLKRLDKADILDFADDLGLVVDETAGVTKVRQQYAEALLENPRKILDQLPLQDLQIFEKLKNGGEIVDAYEDYFKPITYYFGLVSDWNDEDDIYYIHVPKDLRDAYLPHIDAAMNDMGNHLRISVESAVEGLANLYGQVSLGFVKKELERQRLALPADKVMADMMQRSLLLKWMGFHLGNNPFAEPDDDTTIFVSRYGWDMPGELDKEIKRRESVAPDYKLFKNMDVMLAGRIPMPQIPNTMYAKFTTFLSDKLHLNQWEVLETCHDLWYFTMHKGDEDFEDREPSQYFVDCVLDSLEIDDGLFGEAMCMLDNYLNNMPHWQLKGHTPEEAKVLFNVTKEDKPRRTRQTIDYADEWPLSSFPTMPYIAPPKVGRNDPCPCGSGKKYKNCCGRGN